MPLEKFLTHLSEELKLEGEAEKDELGLYRLKLLPNLEMGFFELNPGIYFSAPIIPIPKEGGREALYIYLMQANFIGQGTGGGAIGIDESETYLTLSLSLSFEVSYDIFKERLEDFVNFTFYWQKEVVRFNQTLL